VPRYLILYQVNASHQPTDPKVALKETEASMAGVDELVKAGVFKETGSFNPGEGYILAEFPSREEAYKVAERFWPAVSTQTREVVSWEKTKEIVLSGLKELVEQAE
jgi:uncharacterized protein YciI